jgi:hypothetical protein
VPIFPFKSKTGCEFASALVIFPDFIIAGLSRLSPQRALFVNISLFIRIQFQPPGLLEWSQSIRENDQYFPLHQFGGDDNSKMACGQ